MIPHHSALIAGVFEEETCKFHFVLELSIPNVLGEIESGIFHLELKDRGTLVFTTSEEDQNSDFMSLQLTIENQKTLVLSEFKTRFLNFDDLLRKILFDFVETISFDLNYIKKVPSSFICQKDSLETKIYLNLSLKFCGALLPKPREFDKSLLEILNRPNLDLLNDWLFCHNHSHHDYQNLGEYSMSLFKIPENLSCSNQIVLNQIEQVIYILNESQQILFESIEDKDQSIYTKLICRDFYLMGESYVADNVDNKTNPSLEEQVIRPDLKNCYLVCYKIFRNNQIVDGNHATNVKTLLNKYRMSFVVDWCQIDGDLFRSLMNFLQGNSIFIQKLSNKKFGDIFKNIVFNKNSNNSNDNEDQNENFNYDDLSFLESYTPKL